MTRRFRRRLGRLLLLATALQWLWALPVAIAAELRAIDCCERHCDHGSADPLGCCDVAPAVADGAFLRETGSTITPIAFVFPVIRLAVVHVRPASDLTDPIPPTPRGPTWIRTLSLRL